MHRTVRRVARGAAGVASLALLGVVAPTAPAQAATCAAPGGATITPAADPAGAEVVFTGGGLGHGLGFSQYGAQGAARLGCTAPQILSTYYVGATIAPKTMPDLVQVWMMQDGTRADVNAVDGQVQWRLDGCLAACPPVQPAGATWRVTTDAAKTRFELLDVATGASVWTGGAPGVALNADHSGTVISLNTTGGTSYDRKLRWDSTRYTFNTAGLDAVQRIVTNSFGRAMDKYLWGLGEMPTSWTNGAHEALRAQAIAARTYGYVKVSAGTILYPTAVHQNYSGYAKEAEDAAYKDRNGQNYRWRDAVNSTSGQVVLSASGSVVNTFYSSSFGGYNEDNRYVWGGSAVSYLKPIDDSAWDKASDNPYRAWSRGFTRADLASRLGYTSISSISVPPRGSTARIEGVTVTGVRNGVTVTERLEGWDVKSALDLPSPGFTIKVAAAPLGLSADARPLTGDWDGDGDTDLGWWRDGAAVLRKGDGTTIRFHYGAKGDVPVVGDWDGDGRDTLGTYAKGTWSLRNSLSTGAPHRVVKYAPPSSQAVPVVGNWDGKGGDGLGFTTSDGAWHLRDALTSGHDSAVVRYRGRTGDVPVAGDWDGNGTDTPGVWRSGTWYLATSTRSTATVRLVYGDRAYRPVVGDWNGDGRTTVGLVRGTRWYGINSLATAAVTGGRVFAG